MRTSKPVNPIPLPILYMDQYIRQRQYELTVARKAAKFTEAE